MKFLYFATIAMVQADSQFFTMKSDFYETFLGNSTVTADPTTPCCHSCTEPLEKYHSVDHIFNNCGEACMDPSKFWIYKLFEPGLEKSKTNTPCADRDYTVYKSTPTHGVYPITMTLDLYAPTPKDIETEVEAEEVQDQVK